MHDLRGKPPPPNANPAFWVPAPPKLPLAVDKSPPVDHAWIEKGLPIILFLRLKLSGISTPGSTYPSDNVVFLIVDPLIVNLPKSPILADISFSLPDIITLELIIKSLSSSTSIEAVSPSCTLFVR